jgi:hypothetical protein
MVIAEVPMLIAPSCWEGCYSHLFLIILTDFCRHLGLLAGFLYLGDVEYLVICFRRWFRLLGFSAGSHTVLFLIKPL